MARNPWQVESIKSFNFFCCPECVYRSKEESTFEDHALQNHPQSKILFHDVQVKEEDCKDENLSCDINLKVEEDYDGNEEDFNDTFDFDSLPIYAEEVSEDFDEDKEIVLPKKRKRKPRIAKTEAENDGETVVKKRKYTKASRECVFCHEEVKKKIMTYHYQCRHGGMPIERDGKEVYQCCKCQVEFDTTDGLLDHVKVAHDDKINGADEENSHQCPKCSDVFTDLVDLGTHLNYEHERDPGKFVCPSCPKLAQSRRDLQKHIETMHQNKKTKCPQCNKIVSLHGLRNHILVAHQGDRVNKPFKCSECSFSTHANKYLHAHVIKTHKKESHIHACDQCDKKFAYPHLLKDHKESAHTDEGVNEYVCEKCGDSYSKAFKSLFDRHVQSDCKLTKTEDGIKCASCAMTFRLEGHYIRHHMRIHGCVPPSYKDNEIFLCHLCSTLFANKLSLTMHVMRVHENKVTKTRKQCPHCDKSFMDYSKYEEHVKSKHENNTPFKCNQCHRSYGTQNRLNHHIRTLHQRIKCEECGQEICNSFMLKRHKATVHGIKPSNVFQCKHCPQFYTFSLMLEKHMAKHHPTKE